MSRSDRGHAIEPGDHAMLIGVIERFAVLLVAVAAMLWGTDALFRAPLLQHLGGDPLLQSTQLVTMEHIVLTIVCLPILWAAWREVRSLNAAPWRAVLALRLRAPALATIPFSIRLRH